MADREFGHFGAVTAGGCVDSWGAGPFVIEVDGKFYRFEDSDRFGPVLISRQGDPLTRQPAEHSPFWRGHTAWLRQGRQLATDGQTCIWRPLRPERLWVVGREIVHAEQGEEGAETTIIKGRPPHAG